MKVIECLRNVFTLGYYLKYKNKAKDYEELKKILIRENSIKMQTINEIGV